MPEKLWPKAPAKESVLSQVSKNFHLKHVHFLRNDTKKICNRGKELYYDATIFVFDSSLSPYQDKIGIEKWPKAADSPLFLYFYQLTFNSHEAVLHVRIKMSINNSLLRYI